MPSSTRREVLAAAGSTSLALAGCLSIGSGDGDLGGVNGEWPVDGGNPGHTRQVDAAPTEPGQVWSTELPDARGAGTPTLDDGRLYVPADAVSDRARHRYHLHSLTAAGGEKHWEVSLRADPNASPAASGDRIVVSARRALEQGRVVAFGRRYGDEEWLYDIDARVTAPPTIDGTTVYVPDWDGWVHALSVVDGEVRWARPIGDEDGSREYPSPVAVHDGTLFVGALAGNTGVVAADAATGEVEWTGNTAGVAAGPVVDDGLVAVRTHGTVEAFALDGSEAWSYSVPGDDWRSLALDDRHVYVPSEDTLYAIGRDGSDGWTFTAEADERMGVPTAIGDEVVVCVDGELIGLAADDGTREWSVPTDGTGEVVAVEEGLFLTAPGGHVLAHGDG